MKIFSFVPTSSLRKAYSGLILKYRRYDSTIEFLKVGALVAVLVFSSLMYLLYVNRSSTRGYFLRQENQKLSTIQFDFEILKTTLLDYKHMNRETIQGTDGRRKVVDVRAEVVKLPGNTNLTYNNF
ncbi:MAG: hypothetical protein CO170_04005 [candidate division SR1 bacterium CG_4_9_14_3_um_filter_40_9]|nr:MAG: hypothetical protein CO170_04005 [candidate division SR1 bacterium CG_4_9_14_3_um_filter_40_9]